MELRSFVHDHPLKLQVRGGTFTTESCSICDEKLWGDTYLCRDRRCRNYQVHKSCAHLALRMQHLLHPCPLVLQFDEKTRYCDACFKSSDLKVLYSCKECNFDLDVRCAKKVPTREELISSSGEGLERILHFSHGHPLTVILSKSHEFDPDQNDRCLCKICGEPCLVPDDDDGSIVGCTKCKFYLHGVCLGMLPQQIQHPSHQCSLILYATLSMPTSSGELRGQITPDDQALMFRCGRCDFNLCMPCWLSVSHLTLSDSRKLEHRTLQNSRIRAKDCGVCRRPCLPPIANKATTKCGSSQRTESLPRYIKHASHPSRVLPLACLAEMGIRSMRCHLCRGDCHDLAYLCLQEECPLCLHPECAFLAPTVVSSDHRHPLTVVENIYDDQLKCRFCRASCFNAAALRCQASGCNFSIHIWCGPLPSSITHECHIHPLVLKKYLVNEDGEDDDENSFCCHVCEKPRDPKLCVYHCVEGCHMICEVQCVVSEVIPSLRGQRGDVKLRIAGNPLRGNCKVSTSLDLSKEMNLQGSLKYEYLGTQGEEGNQYQYPQATLRDMLRFSGYNFLGNKEPNRVQSFESPWMDGSKGSDPSDDSNFVLSEEAFTQLIRRLESLDITDDTVPDEVMRELWEGIVDGDGPKASISAILNYYPDILSRIVSGDFEQEALLVAPLFIAMVLESMIITKVADVTEEKLRQWWGYLNWLKQAGFNVQFMFDHLKRVTRAYFGLRARILVAEKQIELDRIAKEMDQLKMRAQVVKNQRDAHLMSMREPAAEFVKQCLIDSRSMRWKPAILGLDGISLEVLDSDGGPSSS